MMENPGEGKLCAIREQVVEDTASGLTLQFEVGADGLTRLRIFGEALPMGNRELLFSAQGEVAGAGTASVPCPPPRLRLRLD